MIISAPELSAIQGRRDERALIAYALLPGGAVEVLNAIRPFELNHPSFIEYLDLMSRRMARQEAVDEASMYAAALTLGRSRIDPAEILDFSGAGGNPDTTSELADVIDRIRGRYMLRRVREAAKALGEIADGTPSRLDGDALPYDANEATARVGQFLLEVVAPATADDDVDLGDAVDEAVRDRQEQRERGKSIAVSTGIASLDGVLTGNGLRPGQLVVIAGATSMGKSALGFGVAADVAERGERVGVVSLEMAKSEVAERILARVSGADLRRISSGDFDHDANMNEWRAHLRRVGFRIWHPPAGATMAQIAAKAMAWRSHGLSLLVVDHLGRVKHDRDFGRRYDLQVGAVAAGCKSLALALQIPVLLLVQLNREGSKRIDAAKAGGGKPRQHEAWWKEFALPQLSDLKESSAIEQEADIVLFPLRATEFGLTDHGAACVVVGKQRNGPRGVVPARWQPHTASYSTEGCG